MLCNHCHGQRIITAERGPHPCPECGGVGETQCCEGLQEQLPLIPISARDREPQTKASVQVSRAA